MNSSAYNYFSGNKFTNISVGFMFEQSENNEVSQNTVDTAAIAAMMDSSGKNYFSKNLLTNNSFGFILLQQSENNEVTGNLLDNSLGIAKK